VNDEPTGPAPFRVCGCCKREWNTPGEFIRDPELPLLGLQLVPESTSGNLLVFGHVCGTSISVFTARLRPLALPLSDVPVPPVSISPAECTRHCKDVDEIAACQRACPRAGDRRLIQLILGIRGEGA
jgi:hypothetical protein